MSDSDLENLVADFNASRLTEFKAADIRSSLLRARILGERDGEVFFRYPHMYYLSCAKALQSQKQDPRHRSKAIEKIRQLISTIHRDESANILVCYLYFSKDLETVDAAVDEAGKLFSTESIADVLQLDFGFTTPWPERLLSEIVLDDKRGIRKQREEMDVAEEARASAERSAESNAEVIAVVGQYVKAVKLIHVLGQVVRSFPAMLHRDLKVSAITAVLGLSFRALSNYTRTFRIEQPELRKSIAEYLALTRSLTDPEEMRERTDRFLLVMAVGTGHGLIKRAAMALSSNHIGPALRAVPESYKGSTFGLVELSVALDQQRAKVNFGSLSKTRSQYEKSGFATLILQQLIHDFMFSYRMPRDVRQRLAQEFNFAPRTLPAGDEN